VGDPVPSDVLPCRPVPAGGGVRLSRYPPDAPHTVTLTSNADGFRSRRELRQPDERTRIVVLGDSMVFGEGVEEPERFTELLETMEPGWRVENLGMVGYGPDLMLRALEHVGLDPVPDVVVLAQFTDDFRRVVLPYAGAGFLLPRYVLRDGVLTTVPYPEPAAWERLHLVQGIRYLRWRYTSATFPLNGAILDRFLALGRRHGFATAVLFLPGPEDHRDDRRRRVWLRDFAAQRTTPFLDLTDALHPGAARYYLPRDPHWNAAGHRRVAETLRPFIAALAPATGSSAPVVAASGSIR
jgi:hypothetical protein